MRTATVYLSYICTDGTADIVLLERMEERYNDSYLQYCLPISCSMTRYAGQICTWLQIYAPPAHHPTIAKSGECMLYVKASKNMDEYIGDRDLSLIYMIQRTMEDKIESVQTQLGGQIESGLDAKADDIVFHEEDGTIQLVSTKRVVGSEGKEEVVRTPIGERILVRTNSAAAITDARIDESGVLVITFDDGTEKELGIVVGKDGAVYVPPR